MEGNSTCAQFSSIECILILKRFRHKHNHKARRERWVGRVRMCGGKGDEHKILVGNSEGKRLLGKIRVDGRPCYNGSYVQTVWTRFIWPWTGASGGFLSVA
jgi:hypothetical protein